MVGVTTRCAQCGTTAPVLPYPPYGDLCLVCSGRQARHDDNRDNHEHLGLSMFGFRGGDE
jgi:hypothetical protein